MCILDVEMMLMVMTINSIVPLPGAQTDSAATDSSCWVWDDIAEWY